MRKIIAYSGICTMVALLIYSGCRKDDGYFDYKNTLREFAGNSYDFLKSQTGVYDSFLLAVDRVGLTDSLKNGAYTVFAPTNASFTQAMEDLNGLRKSQDRPLQYLGNVPIEQLDSLVCKYIVRGLEPSDSMTQQDGLDMPSIRYGFVMHGKLNHTTAEGFVDGGPGVIKYSDTKGSVYTRQWSDVNTVSIDIRTTNGLVNVLERDHIFGFDEFITRVNPTFSQPFLGVPLDIPGTIGFEQYDLGGERVAYHDNDPGNNGNQYRVSEGVDIENSGGGENGYDVGWTNPFEWMNYTVYIAEGGKYRGIIRASCNNDDASLHFELDNRDISGLVKLGGTGNYQNYNDIEFITDSLPPGRHVLKVEYAFTEINVRFVRFLPLNRPFPIPGYIPCEEFDQGGEGVGYHDNDASNNGNKYRYFEGVDIEQNKVGGGYDIGWTGNGEWLVYTVDVKETGLYNLAVRVGSPNNPGDNSKFHVEFDDVDVSGLMECPNTGGWQNWTDVKADVYLTKGVHKMKFFLDKGGYNIRGYKFTAIE